MQKVRTDRRGSAAWILLDSPRNRNALSRQLISEVRQALDAAAADDSVRFVVLSHTGSTFCAGADLTEASSASPAEQPATLLTGLMRAIVTLPKPVIAAVDGHVRAGGMGLVGACDLAIATPRASFGLSEVRLGLAAAVISTVVLPRLADRAAARLFLGGAVVDPEAMVEAGFLNQVVDDLDQGVQTIGDDLDKASPQGLRETKALLNAQLLADFDARITQLLSKSQELFVSDEAREGMAAFLEKRPPRWA